MPNTTRAKSQDDKNVLDPKKDPPADVMDLIEQQADNMLSILIDEDFDTAQLAKMMRRFFSHLAQFSPQLRNLSESDIKCT